MATEIPLQFDLFTGELVDNRSDYQKRLDKARQQPQQQSLFAAHQVAELARPVRPWLAEMPQPSLVLEIQDVRTDEERERELIKAAEQLTKPLFEDVPIASVSGGSAAHALIVDEPADYRVALFHLSKAQLIESRPDLSGEIQRLNDADIEVVASQAQEALRAIYSMVLNITLANYLARKEDNLVVELNP